jgi:hypothetical protein
VLARPERAAVIREREREKRERERERERALIGIFNNGGFRASSRRTRKYDQFVSAFGVGI